MEYRSLLYEAYVSTHFAHVREISPEAVERQRKTLRHYFGRLLPQDRGARILEFGCGYGVFLHFLRREGYQNVEGVEISPEQVELARRLGIPNVTCADGVAFLQDRPERYDCVVAIDVLDHFPKGQVFDVLRAVRNALRPEGRLIVQAVNGSGPLAGRLRYGDFTHEFALTPDSARQLLGAAGFKDIRIFGTDPFVHGFRSLVRVLAWKTIKAVLWVYLVAETGVTRGHILTQNVIAVAWKPAP